MKRFEAFQGLRAMAFLLVFISHSCHYLSLPVGEHGAIGVELFFVLSGFLVELSCKTSEGKSLISQAVSYTRKKLQKFYGLHLILILPALLPVVIKQLIGEGDGWLAILFKLAVNALLVQSWIPENSVYFSLNAVSWYLSTCIFLYFLSPILHRLVSKLPTNRQRGCMLSAVVAAQFAVACIFRSTRYAHAFLYIHPLTRWMDFFSGMLLGSLYQNRTRDLRLPNIAETAALVLLGAVVLVFNRTPPSFRYVLLSVPAAFMLVYVLAQEKGWLSRLLSCKALTFLGGISFEMFMIHQLVIRYWHYAEALLNRFLQLRIPGVVSFVCILAISILGGYVVHKLLSFRPKK